MDVIILLNIHHFINTKSFTLKTKTERLFFLFNHLTVVQPEPDRKGENTDLMNVSSACSCVERFSVAK